MRITPPTNPARVRRFIRLDGLTVSATALGDTFGAKLYADAADPTRIWDADFSKGVMPYVAVSDVSCSIHSDYDAGADVYLCFYAPDGTKYDEELNIFHATTYGAAQLTSGGGAGPSGPVAAMALKATISGSGSAGGSVDLTVKAGYLVLDDLNPRA